MGQIKKMKCIIIGSMLVALGLMGCAKEEPKNMAMSEITTGMLSEIAVGEAAILHAVKTEADVEEVIQKTEEIEQPKDAEVSMEENEEQISVEKEESVQNKETASVDAKGTIKIGTMGTPYSEILTQAGLLLAKEGIDLQIELYNDCYQMSEDVCNGTLDAHLYTHKSYIESFNDVTGAELTTVADVCYEVYGVYSKSNQELTNISNAMKIGIPQDTARRARVLLFMQDMKWIQLKENVGLTAVLADITENASNLEFVEYTQDTLLQVMDETDYCIIGADMAIVAGMDAIEDVLEVESAECNSVKETASVLVAVEENASSDNMKALAKVLRSAELKEYVGASYLGAWELLP